MHKSLGTSKYVQLEVNKHGQLEKRRKSFTAVMTQLALFADFSPRLIQAIVDRVTAAPSTARLRRDHPGSRPADWLGADRVESVGAKLGSMEAEVSKMAVAHEGLERRVVGALEQILHRVNEMERKMPRGRAGM